MADPGAQPDLDDIQNLVDEAMAEVQSAVAQEADDTPHAASMDEGQGTVGPSGIELLSDVELHVKIELGRTQMLVEDVLRLSEGSIVELDKLAGDPVDVYVNDRLIARGEVLVLNDNFCIRISEIVANLQEQAEAAARQQSNPR